MAGAIQFTGRAPINTVDQVGFAVSFFAHRIDIVRLYLAFEQLCSL